MRKNVANGIGLLFLGLCLLLCSMMGGGGSFGKVGFTDERVSSFSVPQENIDYLYYHKEAAFLQNNHTCSDYSCNSQDYTLSGDCVLSLKKTKSGYRPLCTAQEKSGMAQYGRFTVRQTSSAKVASHAGGVPIQPQGVAQTAVQPQGTMEHTFLALAAPVRRSSASFETGELAIGAETVHGGKRYGPGGSGIGDGNGDNNQSAVEKPGSLSDALGFVLLLAGTYALNIAFWHKKTLKCT
ncbi:MAG TPA: hypothetical protein DIW30_04980 [Bacteroidales bacterium]|nr:hypothetical protein [Bacteroidales bacterium]